MSDELEPHARPPELLIEDLSYGPVAIGQWLLDEAREAPITRAVFVTAIAREDGRPPGTVCAYRWDGVMPPDEQIQQSVTDAVTGVILLDNALVVVAWMGALPAETYVVEVEPLDNDFGEQMSPAVAAVYPMVRDLVMRLATEEEHGRTLPIAPFGGGWAPTGTWRAARRDPGPPGYSPRSLR